MDRDPSSPTANAADPFGRSFVLASTATTDPKSAKRIRDEVGRAAHEACGNNGSDRWDIPVSSARIRSAGTSERRIAEGGDSQACFRSGDNLLGCTKAVFRVALSQRWRALRKEGEFLISLEKWCPRRDSNARPSA